MAYSRFSVRARVLLALSHVALAVPLAAQNGNTLTFQPSSIRVSVQQGRSAPPQDVQVIATRTNVEYSVSVQSPQPGLLNIAGSSFITPGRFTIFFGSAPVGHYEGKVTVTASATDVTNPSTDIPVVVDVTSGPALSVSPNPINLSVLKDAAAFTQSVTASSNGDPIPFTATATGTSGAITWLSLSQTTGTTTTQNNVTLNIAPAGLPAGNYSGSLTITPTNSTIASVIVPVNLTVTTAAQLSVDSPSLSFVYQLGQSLPSAQTVNVANAASGQLAYVTTVSTPNTTVNWLRVAATGIAPGPLSISVDPTNLTPGTYNGTITLTASGLQNVTATIQVQLIVSTTPLLTVSPQSLTFETQPNTNPQPKTVTVYSTSATQTYSAQVQAGTDWIFLVAGGVATPQGSAITVAPNIIGKPVGVYTSKLIITTPAGALTPVQTIEVPVTLKITQATILSANPAQVTFDIPQGTAAFQRKDITINSSDPQTTAFTVSVSPASAMTWLFPLILNGTVSSTTPLTLGLMVSPSALTTTRSDAEVILTPTTGSNAQALHIPVTARINTGQVTFTYTPAGTVTFTADLGSAPQAKVVHVTSDPASADLVAQSQNPTWLRVAPSFSNTGTSGIDLTITADPTALTAGVYNGTINVVSTAGTNPLQIPVKLTVGTPATIAVSPANLTFNYTRNQTVPAQQNISVTSGTTAATFAVTSSTNNGNSTWLVPVVTATTTPATVGVKVDPTGLNPGTYTGSVVVTGQGTSNGPQTIGVTLVVQDLPTPVITDVQNGASFQSTAAAPGLIITIRGSNMGPVLGTSAQATNGVMPTVWSDTKVWFDAVAAPVLYVSDTQVNAIVPYQVYGRFSTSVQVERFGVKSNAIVLSVKDAQPGIFALDPGGRGQGAILNQDYAINGANAPAARGSVIQIFATGEGETTPSGSTSNGKLIAANDLRKPITGPVAVRIGGQTAEVLYFGSAPNLVAGAFQVNARVPTNIGAGNQAIEIQVGNNISQTSVTVAVR